MNNELRIYCDGGARGNPGPAACAFVIYECGPSVSAGPSRNPREKRGIFLGEKTNNEAEYHGVIAALSYLSDLRNLNDLSRVTFLLDSELVVRQLTGLYKVKNGRLRELLFRIREQEQSLIGKRPLLAINFSHIPRAENRTADALVNAVLERHGFPKSRFPGVQ
jgi:ribonuclease HI